MLPVTLECDEFWVRCHRRDGGEIVVAVVEPAWGVDRPDLVLFRARVRTVDEAVRFVRKKTGVDVGQSLRLEIAEHTLQSVDH